MTSQEPGGLRTAGRALWADVTGDYELEQHEAVLLREACRAADRLDELNEIVAAEGVLLHSGDRPHPALVEARQQSIALSRLVASLRLPSGEEGGRPQRRGAARGAYGVRPVA